MDTFPSHRASTKEVKQRVRPRVELGTLESGLDGRNLELSGKAIFLPEGCGKLLSLSHQEVSFTRG